MRPTPVLVATALLVVLGGCASARASAGPATAAQPITPTTTAASPGGSPYAPVSPSASRPTPGGTPSGTPSSAAPTPHPAGAPAHFATLPPGSALPGDSQCATWVRARPMAENKGVNKTPNHTTGQHVSGDLFSGDAANAAKRIAPR